MSQAYDDAVAINSANASFVRRQQSVPVLSRAQVDAHPVSYRSVAVVIAGESVVR